MIRGMMVYNMTQPLGQPLPNLPHAISVSMPKWQDVVGYEEGDERIVNSLQSAYPRFLYHPFVAKLFAEYKKDYASDGELCIALPSRKSAEECVNFIKEKSNLESRIEEEISGVYPITFSQEADKLVKAFWQHTGQIISSRQAEKILSGEIASIEEGNKAKQIIKSRISELSNSNDEDVFLFPSGASAIYTIHKALCAITPDAKTVQFGFPYVDTLKVQEKFGTGAHFLSDGGDDDIKKLEQILSSEKIAGLFCEFPGNPLLRSANLERISELLKKHNVPLIVDDTISSWYNVDLKPYADIVVTSLSKFFSGVGDVLAGSIVINDKSSIYNILKDNIKEIHEDILFADDAIILEKNSRDFLERIKQINLSAEKICDTLNNHPKVDTIYYPKFIDESEYNKIKNPEGGYSGLFTIRLKDPEKAPAFHDALDIEKGPSLGTNFTLACPYVLLAHYHELDEVAKHNITKDLIRVSIGLEDTQELEKKFLKALEAV